MSKLRVGMVGLGKLGLPCLLAMERHGGHEVYGFDTSPSVIAQIQRREVSFWEEGVNDYLKDSKISILNSAAALVENCDIIFVAVPTPHEKEFEGSTPTPANRKDFDYSFLESAALDLSRGLRDFPEKNPLIVVISTVLPGTMREKILPTLLRERENLRFAYNPYFIAMGTTISDFLNPEFFLIGSLNLPDGEDLARFYSFIDARVMKMRIESAELTKVAYNTFIGFKIIFANAIAEIVDKRGGDADEVTSALSSANYRIMSGKYFSAGMGDGGGCHPRDQIAMSWLAKDCGLSYDIFESIAKGRDLQTENQAFMIVREALANKLPIVILGKAYKENSPLMIGSPAVLLTHYLSNMSIDFMSVDPFIEEIDHVFREPAVFFVATKHAVFSQLNLPQGSVLIDPWGFVKLESNMDIRVLRPGRNDQREN
jgi:UDPglucose 6-dehydrogenase